MRPCVTRVLLTIGMVISINPAIGFSQSANGSGAVAEKTLRGVYERLLTASETKDERTLRKVLANDYTQVTADGRIRTKEDRIKETVRPNERVKLSLEDFKVRVYRTAAIALCRVKQEGVSDGQSYSSMILSTVTFIRQGNTWQIAATHLTFAKE